MKPTIRLSLCCALIACSTFQADAFSLSGRRREAVDLGEEYRWNIPIVTYAFDQSFLDYFGEKGVKAVEDAFQVLNALPRASRIELGNYPLDSRSLNLTGSAQSLFDLKSVTLARLLDQLGLARPTDHVFDWNGSPDAFATNADLLQFTVWRNFDPQTLQPTQVVNGVLYQEAGFFGEQPVDPLARTRNAVADQNFWPGQLYSGLTRDDVGGLRYLLSRTNINREQLPWVRDPGRRMVWSGGVEKITFVRHTPYRGFIQWLVGSGMHGPGRIALQPDLLFCVTDTSRGWQATAPFEPGYISNRVNNAAWNWTGASGHAGPGVIHGPTRITFGKLGPSVSTGDFGSFVIPYGWGSFSAGTNPPAHYPYQANRIHEALVRLLYRPRNQVRIQQVQMRVPVGLGGTVDLQTSTNGVDWTSATPVVNTGGVIDWSYFGQSAIFFRAIPWAGAPPEPPMTTILTPEEQAILIEAERQRNNPQIPVVLPPTPIAPVGDQASELTWRFQWDVGAQPAPAFTNGSLLVPPIIRSQPLAPAETPR